MNNPVIRAVISAGKKVLNILNLRVSSTQLLEKGWETYLNDPEIQKRTKLEKILSAMEEEKSLPPIEQMGSFLKSIQMEITDYFLLDQISDRLTLLVFDQPGISKAVQLREDIEIVHDRLKTFLLDAIEIDPDNLPNLLATLSPEEASNVFNSLFGHTFNLEKSFSSEQIFGLALKMGDRLTKLDFTFSDDWLETRMKKETIRELVRCCPNLTELSFPLGERMNLTCKDLESLSDLKNLKTLKLNDINLADIENLSTLKSLENLRLVRPQTRENLTDFSLSSLKRDSLPGLKTLNLRDCSVSHDELAAVCAACPQLESLELSLKGQILDEDVDRLKELTHLTKLKIESPISDDALATLRKQTDLKLESSTPSILKNSNP